MIIEIKEYQYKGITLNRVEDQGWKCILGDREYLFPHCQAAEAAIDEIFWNIKPIISKNKGKKVSGRKEMLCQK